MDKKELVKEVFGNATPEWIADKGVELLEKFENLKRISSEEEKRKLEDSLLQAIWIMRWTQSKRAMYAVLTEYEAESMLKEIFIELEKDGFEIVHKNIKK